MFTPQQANTGENRSLLVSLTVLTTFGVVIGIAAGALSTLFVQGIHWASAILQATPDAAEANALLLLAVLLVGSLIVGLLQPESARSPIDVIEATHCHNGKIEAADGARGTAASFVALSCGASAGQYGPLVYFGAAIGSVAAGASRLTGGLLTIGAGCGVAAAIAAAFAAPIAGVVFAHEVLLRHYSIRAFAPITVAAVTAHFFGTPLFAAPTLVELHQAGALPASGYPLLVVLGLICAPAAKYFMHLVEACNNLATRVAPYHPGCDQPVQRHFYGSQRYSCRTCSEPAWNRCSE